MTSSLKSIPAMLPAAAVVALALGAAPRAGAVPVVFQGYDPGAASLATAPNAKTASDAFDLATGPLTVFDFDTNTTGASLSPASSPQSCGFALCGGNTTPSGSGWYGAVYTTTITFASPVNSFGAYFSGWQRDDQTLSYFDGTSTVTLNMPAGLIGSGGLVFFGFIDNGASISSATYSTVLGDYVGIDDMRFGTVEAVPEPASLTLFGLGLVGLRWAARRRRMR